MDGFRISNRVDRDFGMVPRALWLMDISAAAKTVAAYLCCLRDGEAVPPVAAIEQHTGLGRDARRRAFAELERAGVIAWQRDRVAGRIVARWLAIDHAAIRAPESQAVGAGAGYPQDRHRAPEKPSDGVSVTAVTEKGRVTDAISGCNLKEEKRRRARNARAAIGGPRALPRSAEPEAGPKELAEPVERRRAIAAELGLRVRGPDGQWLRASEYRDERSG